MKNKDFITDEEFLNLELKDISQVYNGIRDSCRCGCGGKYIATSFMDKPRSEVNDELVAKLLAKAKKLVLANSDTRSGGTYFDVAFGKTKSITFYIDELIEVKKEVKGEVKEVKDLFNQNDIETILQHEIHSRIMEQASDTAEKLTELDCKLASIECYVVEMEDDTEVSSYTEEAQDIFNIHYDQQMEELYSLLNRQLTLIKDIKN